MKQRFYLFLLLLSVTVRISAQTVIGDFTYTFSGNEATVTASSLTSGAVVIPETVVYGGNTYNVTAISFTTTPFNFCPTSITGNSIKSITGPHEVDNAMNPGSSTCIFYPNKDCASINFPQLKTLKNCTLYDQSIPHTALTSAIFPELETIDGVYGFLFNCPNLSTISLPKLKILHSGWTLSKLPLIASLTLPELTDFKTMSSICELPALTTLSLPKLKTIDTHMGLSNFPLLQTITLPELVSIDGVYFFESCPKLHTLNAPKLQSIQSGGMMSNSGLSVLNLGYGCEIEALFTMMGMDPSVTSLTINGATKIGIQFFAPNATTLKHVSFPDAIEFSGDLGNGWTAIESFSAPKLKKLYGDFFSSNNTPHLTTVDIHSLEEVINTQMFKEAPVTSLTLRGDLKADANSAMTLNAYPTVITIDDQSTVHDIPATFFEHIKGGRFIAPRGKAALYATKWNLPLNHTMIYAPVKYEKHTYTSKYASGSIAPADGAFVYGGITYTNQYDFHQAMLPGECLASNVLGPNDLGFTPSLPSLTVSDRTDYMSPFKTYYASAYANTPNRKEGVLTLTPLANTPHSTVQGFGAAAADLYEGVGTAAGGFLCNGNNDGFSALYMPYVPDAVPTPATNYLIAGDDGTQTSRTGGLFKFYWHPGDAAYPMGFYECAATTIPETRAYLSLPMSLSPRAKEIRLVFEDDQPTGISDIDVPTDTTTEAGDAAWYTLLGIRLTAKPTAPGVYLHGSRKVIIR